jgi:hypothetical protein
LAMNIPSSYTIKDVMPLKLSYYRLRTVDVDGAKQVSKTIHISRGNEELININIAPNPTSSSLKITLDELKTVDYAVFSAIGQRVLTGVIKNGIAEIDLQELSKGLYFLKIEAAGKVMGVKKITLIK